MIGRQPADNFTQRIFAGNLSIETGQELLVLKEKQSIATDDPD